MRRALIALVLLAVTLPLAACGASADLSAVAQAAERTQNARTARFSLVINLAGARVGALTGEGAVDYEAKRGRMTFNLVGLGELGREPVEVAIDGTAFYAKFPLLSQTLGRGKPWVKVDVGELAEQAGIDLGQLGELGRLDPTQALAYLRAAGDFDEVGRETVRGVETTHYSGAIDLRKALDKVEGSAREQLRQLLDGADIRELPADAWIDGEGYLRKLAFKFAGLPGGGGVAAVFELYDLGAEVDVTPPPPDEVTDLTELAKQGSS